MSVQKPDRETRFIALYQTYIDEVYPFIYARCGFEAAIAEDITQDIFVDVLNGLDRFKGLCSQRTWVYRIARNKLNDYYRKQSRCTLDTGELEEADETADPAQDIERQMERTFESRFIRECLDTLPLQYRFMLVMKYVDGQSVKQIAELTGKTPKATESMLQRAKGAFIREYQSSKTREDG